MTLMCAVMAVHLLYITYLHFGFHVVVEGTLFLQFFYVLLVSFLASQFVCQFVMRNLLMLVVYSECTRVKSNSYVQRETL